MGTDATTVVVGCGIAGLGAAQVLRTEGADYMVLEEEDGPGGLLRTDQVGEFLFDRGGHFVHSRSRSFESAISNSGIEFREYSRRSSVILGEAIVPYPLQFNLWAAPQSLRERVKRDLPALSSADPTTTGSFAEALMAEWGPALTETFFRPYHEKMLSVRLDQLPANWGATFIPRCDVARLKKGLDQPVAGYGYNAKFLFPVSGRIGELPETLARVHAKRIRFESKVKSILLSERILQVATAKGDASIPFSSIVATVPLPHLLWLCRLPARPNLLKHASVLNIRVGFRGRVKRQDHWYYVPDAALPFFRIGVPSNLNARVCPPDCASLSIECPGDRSGLNAAAVARSALAYLQERDVLDFGAIEALGTHLITPAYVHNRMSGSGEIRSLIAQLEKVGIMAVGRFGQWDYFSMDQSFQSGVDGAMRAVAWNRRAPNLPGTDAR